MLIANMKYCIEMFALNIDNSLLDYDKIDMGNNHNLDMEHNYNLDIAVVEP